MHTPDTAWRAVRDDKSAAADRELIEAAALAAGERLEGVEPDGRGVRINGTYWQPLHDDGDALRLAVRLGMDMLLGRGLSTVTAPEGHDTNTVSEDHAYSDPYAATRRAIVRAAAATVKKGG